MQQKLTTQVKPGECRFCPVFNKTPGTTFKIKDTGLYQVRYCTNCGVGLHATDTEGRIIFKSKNANAKVEPQAVKSVPV